MSESEPWMPVEGVARHLGANDTVHRWLEAHSLPAHMIGRRWKNEPLDECGRAGGGASETGGAG